MNKTFLDAQLRKMVLAFGGYDRNHDEKSEVWYGVLKDRLTERQLMDTVEQAVLSFDRYPSLKQFLDLARSKENPNKPQQTAWHFCPSCNSTGILIVVRSIHDHPYKYAYRCNRCDNCQYDYPTWDGTGTTYDPLTYQPCPRTKQDAPQSTISDPKPLDAVEPQNLVEAICETMGARIQEPKQEAETEDLFAGVDW